MRGVSFGAVEEGVILGGSRRALNRAASAAAGRCAIVVLMPMSPGSDGMRVFDHTAVRRHRARAASRFADHDFLFREVAARLADRLDDIRRRFPQALDLGARHGVLRRALHGRGGIRRLVECTAPSAPGVEVRSDLGVVADAEALPFAPASFDLVLSCLALHWANDLPGTLIQARQALRPDGLFLAALLGGETLNELRRAWLEAEAVEEGGASPRVSPFVDVRDAGALLQRAGFALPVADSDTITVTYADPLALMHDLRAMGETNALLGRRQSFTRRATLAAAIERYRTLYAGPDGRIPATFQVIYLTGWAPHEAQPKPLRPGSAAARLADALRAREQSGGEKATLREKDKRAHARFQAVAAAARP